jgi:serine/threonine protein kinase
MANRLSVATISSPEFINIEGISPFAAKCEVKVLYLGGNRNGSYITKEVATQMAETLPGTPIVGYYSEKADVYSFGIILWELWSRDPPYKGIIAKDVGNMVKKDKNYRPTIPKEVPKEIKELMKLCWDFDPAKRPCFLEIINCIENYLRLIE